MIKPGSWGKRDYMHVGEKNVKRLALESILGRLTTSSRALWRLVKWGDAPEAIRCHVFRSGIPNLSYNALEIEESFDDLAAWARKYNGKPEATSRA